MYSIPRCYRCYMLQNILVRDCETSAVAGDNLAFTRYSFHFEALLHNYIIYKHPIYYAIYYTCYHLLHPPPNLKYIYICIYIYIYFFSRHIYIFFRGRGRISDGSRVKEAENKSVSRHKKGYYCTLLCNTPLTAPLCSLLLLRNIFFPRPPFYCNKILTISCKGQPAMCRRALLGLLGASRVYTECSPFPTLSPPSSPSGWRYLYKNTSVGCTPPRYSTEYQSSMVNRARAANGLQQETAR